MASVTDEFSEWLQVGIDNGWVTEPFCNTHEGAPMTDAEYQEWDDGHDPCLFAVRLVDEDSRAGLIEGNRS